MNGNREGYFYSTRDAIPTQELEDLEEVWRILKAHDKTLDNTLIIINVSTSARNSSQILKFFYFRIPKTAPCLIKYTEILN